MRRTQTRLTASTVLSLEPHCGRNYPRLVCDGGGLYLQIMPSGSRSYIFRYTLGKRTRAKGLGSASSISLSDARKAARELKVEVDRGTDPLGATSNATRRPSIVTHRMTFKHCAEAYIASHRPSWKSEKHAAQWESTLSSYVYPHIGRCPVADVSVDHLKEVLTPIWSTINETASRTRGRIEKVLAWATVNGFRHGENPARWNGYLSEIFPKRSAVRAVTHHDALPYVEMPAFMAELRRFNTQSSALLQLLILTAVRTTEARAAKWCEFDLANALWVVPAERMKAGREHRVPLSAPALQLLETLLLRHLDGTADESSHYVFPGRTESSCVSNMAALMFVRKQLGRANVTPHGMRSTFRDWVAECTIHQREVAEAALAHTLTNRVEAAYQRGDFLEKRRVLMEDWGTFCLQGCGTAAVASPKALHLV